MKNITECNIRRYPLFAAAAWLVLSSSTYAQVLEEVIVTATMRAESVQDVPLSISALSADDIKSIGAYRLDDLNNLVPNVRVSEGAIENILSIRGVHSSGNQGFEQAVGIFRDGLYTGRSQLSRLPFLDVETIEIVRGPQGVLFGKSTISGAITLRTKNPTDEVEVGARTQIALDDDQDYEFEGIVSGPLSENLRARLAARYRDSDGYVLNEPTGENIPKRDEYALRGTLQWDVTNDVTATLKAEHTDFEDNGRPFEVYFAPAGTPLGGLEQTLNGVTRITNSPNQGGPGSTDAGPADDFAGFVGSDREFPFSESDVQVVSLKLEAGFGEYNIESTTGYATYDFRSHIDGDFGPFPLITNIQSEGYEQFSQEIRLLSPTYGRYIWVAGFYYEDNSFSFDEQIDVVPFGILQKFATDFDQDEENISAFGQLTIDLLDNLSLTGGVRYTNTKKDATQSQVVTDILPIGSLIPTTPDPMRFTLFSLGITNHLNVGSRSKDRIDWSVSGEYAFDWSGEHTFYATVAQGSKAGGFDARATATVDQGVPGELGSFEYLKETAITYEIGLKSLWLDGALQWNWAFYHTEFEDLQESVYDGGLTFQVQNAPAITVEGFETDVTWQVTEDLTLWGNLGYIDYTIDSFPCSPGEVAATPAGQTCVSPRILADNGSNPTIPDWTGAFGFNYMRPINGSLNFMASTTVRYSDSINASLVGNPIELQDPLTILDFQVGVGSSDGLWSVGLLGTNMTNEDRCDWFGIVPLGNGAVNCISRRQRTFSLQADYNY